jgi:hypothetical protein
MVFEVSSEAKLRDIKKVYQSIVSMEEETPMIDYEKY